MTNRGDTAGTLGPVMTVLAWVLAAGLLTLLFSGVMEDWRNPNRTLTVHAEGERPAVALKRNRYGHYVASGHINGEPVTLMVDTGASDVAVPESIARRLDLPRGAARTYHTANGTITARQTRLDSLRLGPLELRNVPASIHPALPGDGVLLGMSVLRHLELVQKGDTLTLRPM